MDARPLDERFAEGSEAALADAIALYGQPLLRYCHHILCDYHEAQDAVQTTFIKAYDNHHRFRPGTSLSAWLYRLAYTTCVDLLRHRKRQLVTPPPVAADPDYTVRTCAAHSRPYRPSSVHWYTAGSSNNAALMHSP